MELPLQCPARTHTHTLTSLAEQQDLTHSLPCETAGTAGWQTGGGLGAVEREQCKRMGKGELTDAQWVGQGDS